MRRPRIAELDAVQIATLIAAGLLFTWASHTSADQKKPDKPQTHITQTLSPGVYKQMELAQKAFEAKDYKAAEGDLDQIKAKEEKLNDYEKATLWNLYAAVFRAEDNSQKAAGAYIQVLKQNNLPEGLRNDALFSLAQTYFLMEDYPKSVAVMKKWFSVVQEVQPDAYVLLAQAYYQMKDYRSAKEPLIKALAIAKQRNQPFKENWLGLLRAVFFELKDYPNATKVMEVLTTQYPKDSYFLQLSGLYGLQGDQQEQAAMMHVAYLGGYVHNQSDVLNVARLYMAQDAPQRAVDLLQGRLRDKTLESNVENLQLLTQAMSLARDVEASIPILAQLAQMSGESRHYNYLGQAYTQQGEWSKAAEAFTSALHAKNVSNPGSLQMQLGTALYNAAKLAQARDAFVAAAGSPAEHDAAANWIKFINTEMQRNEALRLR